MDGKLILPLLVALLATSSAAQVQKPDNITIEISGLSQQATTYIDDSQTEGPVSSSEFPYIAVERDSYLRGIVTSKLNRAENKDGKITLNTPQEPAKFYLPFTEGTHRDIEEREDEILGGEFLDRVNPSFGFDILDEGKVRVAYISPYNTDGFTEELERSFGIIVRHRLDGDSSVDILYRIK